MSLTGERATSASPSARLALAARELVACFLGGSPDAPLVIARDAELQAHLSCLAGAAAPGIDLAASDLYLVTHSLSPA